MKLSTNKPSFESLENRRLMSASYQVIDLGIIDTPQGSAITGITDSGIVYNNEGYFAKNKKNKYTFVPFAPTGGTHPEINQILENGRIAGTMYYAGEGSAPTLFTKMKGGYNTEKLAQLHNGESTYAQGMNNNGVVVGYGLTDNYGSEAFMTYVDPQGKTKLLNLNSKKPAGVNFELRRAEAITDSGWMIVSGNIPGKGTSTRAAMMKIRPDGSVAFKELTPYDATQPTVGPSAINESGWVTGSSTIPGFNNYAGVVWRLNKKGNMTCTPLQTLGGDETIGSAINDKGQVVGDSCVKYGFSEPTVWNINKKGKFAITNLQKFLPNTLDGRWATAINNNGWIGVESFDSNYNTHALLLIPKAGKAAPAAETAQMNAPKATPSATTAPKTNVFATRPIESKEVWA